MKRALINQLEPERICEIREVGEEFEVAESFKWIDCPDDITTFDKFHQLTGEFEKYDILKTPGIENAYKVARQIAYTSIGEQLDMIYKELQASGTLSADGQWATHITAVKSAIPKDPEGVIAYYNSQNQQP